MTTASRDQDDELVLTGPLARWPVGPLARWLVERAEAEGRSEAEVIEEALSIRWGRQLGDAFSGLWEAGTVLDESDAERLVHEEIYRPRQERRRQAG
ncbi:MAG TPA: hypothetical protein VK988_22450 [Acidimicrobiales bacterium]|nr:hypothetical protein [Acidimicrobiales bacterium]